MTVSLRGYYWRVAVLVVAIASAAQVAPKAEHHGTLGTR